MNKWAGSDWEDKKLYSIVSDTFNPIFIKENTYFKEIIR